MRKKEKQYSNDKKKKKNQVNLKGQREKRNLGLSARYISELFRVMKSMPALKCSLSESTAHYFSTVSQSIKNPTVKKRSNES